MDDRQRLTIDFDWRDPNEPDAVPAYLLLRDDVEVAVADAVAGCLEVATTTCDIEPRRTRVLDGKFIVSGPDAERMLKVVRPVLKRHRHRLFSVEAFLTFSDHDERPSTRSALLFEGG